MHPDRETARRTYLERHGVDPTLNRTQVEDAYVACYQCREPMDVWSGDPRARGWLRGECSACGAWCDVDPSPPGEPQGT